MIRYRDGSVLTQLAARYADPDRLLSRLFRAGRCVKPLT